MTTDLFHDSRISLETRVELNQETNLSPYQIMDRAGLDYFHPDGDGYTGGCTIRKTSVSGVILGIDAVQDIPSPILDQAKAIFNQTGFKEARKRRKTYIIFGCIYNAALAMNHPVILPDLARKCGMEPSEITSAMSVFNKCYNKDLIVSTHMTPNMFVYTICRDINLESLSEDIQTVLTEVLDRAPALMDSQPILVTAATVLYYTNILGMKDITSDRLAEVSKLTASSIDKMSKSIRYYHNDCDE